MPELSVQIKSLLTPFLDPSSRTHWLGLVVFLVMGLVCVKRQKVSLSSVWQRFVRSTSTHLDVQLLIVNRLLKGLLTGTSVFATWWFSLRCADLFRFCFGDMVLSVSMVSGVALYSVVLFLVEDVTRFTLHKAFHQVPWLWRFHQVHHSATLLTPLTFFRVHPVESILYQLRSIVSVGFVAGVMYWWAGPTVTPLEVWGVPAIGFALNTLFGNFRHSHLFIQFPPWLERWIVSPAQHQIHHSIEVEHKNRNFGTWLSIWDRYSGTLLVSTEPPTGFGLVESNHQQGVVSAITSPLWRNDDSKTV